MIDSFEKLTDICINNKLGAETVDYLVVSHLEPDHAYNIGLLA